MSLQTEMLGAWQIMDWWYCTMSNKLLIQTSPNHLPQTYQLRKLFEPCDGYARMQGWKLRWRSSLQHLHPLFHSFFPLCSVFSLTKFLLPTKRYSWKRRKIERITKEKKIDESMLRALYIPDLYPLTGNCKKQRVNRQTLQYVKSESAYC